MSISIVGSTRDMVSMFFGLPNIKLNGYDEYGFIFSLGSGQLVHHCSWLILNDCYNFCAYVKKTGCSFCYCMLTVQSRQVLSRSRHATSLAYRVLQP